MTNDIKEKILERFNKEAFVTGNHISIETLEDGFARIKMDVGDGCANQFGNIHGGALCTLVDQVSGTAAQTDGRNYVVTGVNVNYVKNQDHGPVFAEGRVSHCGRRTAVVEVRIYGDDRKLLVVGTGNLMCLD